MIKNQSFLGPAPAPRISVVLDPCIGHKATSVKLTIGSSLADYCCYDIASADASE